MSDYYALDFLLLFLAQKHSNFRLNLQNLHLTGGWRIDLENHYIDADDPMSAATKLFDEFGHTRAEYLEWLDGGWNAQPTTS